jgi:hypothetical protein
MNSKFKLDDDGGQSSYDLGVPSILQDQSVTEEEQRGKHLSSITDFSIFIEPSVR